MKLYEFTNLQSDIDDKLNYDVAQDLYVYMRNDPMFYRKAYFPVVAKLADKYKADQDYDVKTELMPVLEKGMKMYCKQYNINRRPEDVFTDDDKRDLIDQMFFDDIELDECKPK